MVEWGIKMNPKNIVDSMLFYRRVHADGTIGECENCGKRRKLYDDLCKECRRN